MILALVGLGRSSKNAMARERRPRYALSRLQSTFIAHGACASPNCACVDAILTQAADVG